MSFLAPDDPDYERVYGDAIDRYADPELPACCYADLDAELRASERAAGQRPSPASEAPDFAAIMRRIDAADQAHAEIREASSLTAAQDRIEDAIAAGVTGADLLAASDRTGSCPRCGQTLIGDGTVCDACRQLDREPQGETFALFDPTPYSAHQAPAIRGQEEMF